MKSAFYGFTPSRSGTSAQASSKPALSTQLAPSVSTESMTMFASDSHMPPLMRKPTLSTKGLQAFPPCARARISFDEWPSSGKSAARSKTVDHGWSAGESADEGDRGACFERYCVISSSRSEGERRDAYMARSRRTFHSSRRTFAALGIRDVLLRKVLKKMDALTQCM